MKKLIILLAVLPLVLSSCLKDDKDAFGKTASERIREVQEGTEKALTGAANGWLMEYYPSATQEYGGIAIYMKFQNGTVTVTSEAGGAGKTAESLYSYDQDYGPTINFDTYNPYFHIYSEPNSGVGPTNTGMGGDSEFIIMSYAADKVVLRGKKTQNTIVLTPLPETAWNTMFGKYSADVTKMDNFRSYELVLNGKTYDISREVAAGYNSRYFSVVTENGTIPASFIYTQDTGLKFYEPLVVDGVSIEEMTWSGGMFTDEVSGARIQETVSNNKFTFAVSDIKATSVNVEATPTVANEYYYFDVVPSSAFANASDEDILYELMDGITSMNQLSRGKMKKTLTVDSDTEYIPCAFGLKIVNGWVYPITELAKGTAFMSGQGDPMSPESSMARYMDRHQYVVRKEQAADYIRHHACQEGRQYLLFADRLGYFGPPTDLGGNCRLQHNRQFVRNHERARAPVFGSQRYAVSYRPRNRSIRHLYRLWQLPGTDRRYEFRRNSLRFLL